MSFGGPDVPAVPNPQITADQQQKLNQSTLETLQSANNVNQVTPTGSLTYTQTGVGANGTPTYTATQTLSPAQQSLLEQLQGNQATAGSAASKLLAGANYGATDPSKIIGDATSGNTQALLKQETDYLAPQFKSQTDQLDTKLRTQGIFPDSPAYQQQMRDLQLNQNQAITGFLATAEPQAYQQAVTSYGLPASMAASFMGLQAPAGLGLTTTPQSTMNPANLEGDVSSANTANMAAYNAEMNQQNAMMSGLFGLGAAGISGGTAGFGGSMLGSLLPLAAAV